MKSGAKPCFVVLRSDSGYLGTEVREVGLQIQIRTCFSSASPVLSRAPRWRSLPEWHSAVSRSFADRGSVDGSELILLVSQAIGRSRPAEFHESLSFLLEPAPLRRRRASDGFLAGGVKANSQPSTPVPVRAKLFAKTGRVRATTYVEINRFPHCSRGHAG
jgi:hypothetical protein